jgi:hypothetical protein
MHSHHHAHTHKSAPRTLGPQSKHHVRQNTHKLSMPSPHAQSSSCTHTRQILASIPRKQASCQLCTHALMMPSHMHSHHHAHTRQRLAPFPTKQASCQLQYSRSVDAQPTCTVIIMQQSKHPVSCNTHKRWMPRHTCHGNQTSHSCTHWYLRVYSGGRVHDLLNLRMYAAHM